jgi:hypothetical protein
MDIGYHFDLTTRILHDEGFSPESIDPALVGNGLTDILGNLPWNIPLDIFIASKSLHCDNLFTEEDVTRYWKQFLWNLKAVVQKCRDDQSDASASAEKKRHAQLQCLYAIGTAFHVLQDLCSHSNWCELQKEMPFYKGTKYPNLQLRAYHGSSVFKNGGLVQGVAGLLTGRFGAYYVREKPPPPAPDEDPIKPWIKTWRKYTPELDTKPQHGHAYRMSIELDAPGGPQTFQNLDHQDRWIKRGGPRVTYWDEAYVTAYYSCRHLISQIKSWIGAVPFLDEIMHIWLFPSEKEAIAGCLDGVTKLSLYIKFEDDDGHWKGPGSGDRAMLAPLLRHFHFAPTFAQNVTLDEIERLLVAEISRPQLARLLKKLFPPAFDDIPLGVQIYLTLLTDTPLMSKMYVEAMGLAEASEIKIEVPPPPINERLITISVRSLTIPPQALIGEPGPEEKKTYVSHFSGVGPQPFVRVVFRTAKPSGKFEETRYRERTIQSLACTIDKEWIARTPEYYPEPWQVVHVLPGDVEEVECEIHLYDEGTFNFFDDEFRINPVPTDPTPFLKFKVAGLKNEVPQLAESEVTKLLKGSEANYNITKGTADDGVPVVFTATGSKEPNRFIQCPRANLTFYVAVATVEQ